MPVRHAFGLEEDDGCSMSPRYAFRTPVGNPVTVHGGTVQRGATLDSSSPEASVKWYHAGSIVRLSQRADRTALSTPRRQIHEGYGFDKETAPCPSTSPGAADGIGSRASLLVGRVSFEEVENGGSEGVVSIACHHVSRS